MNSSISFERNQQRIRNQQLAKVLRPFRTRSQPVGLLMHEEREEVLPGGNDKNRKERCPWTMQVLSAPNRTDNDYPGDGPLHQERSCRGPHEELKAPLNVWRDFCASHGDWRDEGRPNFIKNGALSL